MTNIDIKDVSLSDENTLRDAAELITKYSWGEDYPVDPLEEIQKSEYCAGAYAKDKLVGFATVNRFASPDGKDNGELWLGHAVVIPEFREQGIYQKLYTAQMEHTQRGSGRILSCTSNPIIENFLSGRGWQEIRKTKDEEGGECSVFEYSKNTS
ncbi:MAG TPA: GNAT family N-acetyltransferase [Candidatus Paceibacterota bacterium]